MSQAKDLQRLNAVWVDLQRLLGLEDRQLDQFTVPLPSASKACARARSEISYALRFSGRQRIASVRFTASICGAMAATMANVIASWTTKTS